jgi:tripartite-type tricarboxylate transporter receptor subunit TctC
MKFPHRRKFLHLAAGAVALPAVSRSARAQAYPSRPVHIIVPLAAGGGLDLSARLIGQWLSERFGQSFVVDNRPGGGGNIAAEAVVRAPADGYTLLLVSFPNAVNTTLYDKLNFNFVRDIAAIASINISPHVMLAHPSVPAKSIPELVAYAKANAGKLNMASSGSGTPGHVAGELFKLMTGINIAHVPYRGAAPALTDLLGGQVQLLVASTAASIEYVKAGKLRALGLTTSTRLDVLPDVPTVGELVPGYEAIGWTGIGAPRNTSPETVDRLNKEINAGLAEPRIKARLADVGGVPMSMTPAEFGKFIADETEKWAKVVRFAGIKPE